MPTPSKEVIQKLASFGSLTGELIQSQRLGQAGIVADGICRGICLDWARRVLQSGGPSFADSERPKSQTRRQARIHSCTGARMQEGNAVNKAFVRYVNEFYNPACDTRANVRTPDEVKTVLRQHFPGEAVQDVYSFNDATGICDKLEKLQNTLNHKTSVGWAAFAQQLDKEYLAARSSEGRRAGARPFSGIRITESESNTDFPKAIATIRELPENSVIILGVDRQIKSGSDPHSVAVFKVNKEIFQFLDANYGVFQYDIKGVLKALLYLFKEFEGKTGIYGEDGASVPGTLNYVVFTA